MTFPTGPSPHVPHPTICDITAAGGMSKDTPPTTFDSLISKIERGNTDIYVSLIFDTSGLACVTVKVGKYGSDTASFVTGWYSAVNVALAHGVPWEALSAAAKEHKDVKHPSMLHSVVVEIDRLLEGQAPEQSVLTHKDEPVTVDNSLEPVTAETGTTDAQDMKNQTLTKGSELWRSE